MIDLAHGRRRFHASLDSNNTTAYRPFVLDLKVPYMLRYQWTGERKPMESDDDEDDEVAIPSGAAGFASNRLCLSAAGTVPHEPQRVKSTCSASDLTWRSEHLSILDVVAPTICPLRDVICDFIYLEYLEYCMLRGASVPTTAAAAAHVPSHRTDTLLDTAAAAHARRRGGAGSRRGGAGAGWGFAWRAAAGVPRRMLCRACRGRSSSGPEV